MTDQPLTPAEQVRRLYEEAEERTSTALEDLVASEGFGEILAMVTANSMAVIKVASEGLDTMVRVLRLAGRNDIARLGRQQARTEDKLEYLLQLVEKLEQRLEAADDGGVVQAASGSSGRSGRGSAAKAQESR